MLNMNRGLRYANCICVVVIIAESSKQVNTSISIFAFDINQQKLEQVVHE